MLLHTKSALLLLATLVIGLVLGALATSAIMAQRVEEIQALRQPPAMGRFIESVVGSADEARRRQIREVIRRYAGRQMALRERMHHQHRQLLDSLRAEIAPLLDSSQQERLNEFLDRQRMPPGGRGDPDRGL